MAEEKGQAAPAAAPAPEAPKKSSGAGKGCTIAIIVVLVIILLVGAGIYGVYRYVKSKVNVDNNSTSINIGGTEGSVSNSGNTFSDTTEQTPTADLVKNVNSDIKGSLAKIYGSVKVSAWASYDENYGSITYITKDKITVDSSQQAEAAVKAAGYSENFSNYTSSTGMMMSGTKGDVTAAFVFSIDEDANIITVTINRNTN